MPADAAEILLCCETSRYITHNRKLKDGAQTSEKFISQTRELGKRLGPVLFQLPPSWRVNRDWLAEFLSELPRTHHYVFEFRNEGWNTPEVYDVLCRYNAAFCMFELAGFQSPMEVTADFAYVRLHGPGNKYQGDYGKSQLRTWAKRIEGWRKTLKHIFIYFDNDQVGFAAKNAMELKRTVIGS